MGLAIFEARVTQKNPVTGVVMIGRVLAPDLPGQQATAMALVAVFEKTDDRHEVRFHSYSG
jgi:hypothetical protein